MLLEGMTMLSDRHYYDEIRRQTTLEDASTVLAESAIDMGWDLAAFHADIEATDLPRTRRGAFIAEAMGWPRECLHGWRQSQLGRHCPIAALCSREAQPFHWSCDEKDASWFDRELACEQRSTIRFYGRYVADGLAVPVRLVRGGTGYVSWCSSRGRGRELTDGNLSSVFFISHAFMRHAEALLDDERYGHGSGRLTARERECLTWAARGRTEEEIGQLIHRSRDTVHFHLGNVLRKLDADNRTHAVAIACTRGLISLR